MVLLRFPTIFKSKMRLMLVLNNLCASNQFTSNNNESNLNSNPQQL
ncbi:hypothetical protein C5167_032917 [Papaver somniferum]|uniref:Uncharacterized protein n=1 Tax=Papaver somniferum TaxID=3469 RepID=A0A4Y7KBQ9_PAPSO|nr:hypothetical protein C5167_032917 [Papaver somniferum]